MILRLIPLAGLLLLGGCAHDRGALLPTCDGSARRPANPHGSVLSPPASPPVAEPPSAPVTTPNGGCA